MAFSHTITNAVKTDGDGLSAAKSYSGSNETKVSELIAVGTDTLVQVTLDVSAVKSFYMLSDRAISVETNATDHAGGNILALLADVPYVWNTDSYDTFKLTSDVTKLYITNASGGSAQFDLRAIVDATP